MHQKMWRRAPHPQTKLKKLMTSPKLKLNREKNPRRGEKLTIGEGRKIIFVHEICNFVVCFFSASLVASFVTK